MSQKEIMSSKKKKSRLGCSNVKGTPRPRKLKKKKKKKKREKKEKRKEEAMLPRKKK